MKNKLNLLVSLDERLWGGQVESNKYFATLSMLLAALLGIVLGGGQMIASMFDADMDISMASMVALLIVVVCLNIGESIMVSATPKIAFSRSLLVTAIIVGALVLGFVGSIIVVILIVLYLLLMILLGVLGAKSGSRGFSGSGGSSDDSSGEGIELGSGRRIEGRSSFDGETFFGNNGETYRKSGMGSRSWDKVDD